VCRAEKRSGCHTKRGTRSPRNELITWP
jgi:hypothetical protein